VPFFDRYPDWLLVNSFVLDGKSRGEISDQLGAGSFLDEA
jgi:hypothetical protein